MKENIITNNWPVFEIKTIDEIERFFEILVTKRWVFRGQRAYATLFAPIDRPPLNGLARIQKLYLEDQSIKKLVSSVKFPSDEIELQILGIDTNNCRLYIEKRISILMLLQHYNCPTRLLDWSANPYIALYFAITQNYGFHDDEDGEVWCFDGYAYDNIFGPRQWPSNPEVYDSAGEFDNSIPSLFTEKGPKGDWFVMQALNPKFHRLEHQAGFFSVTSQFGIDHAIAIQRLFSNNIHYYCRCVIKSEFKPELRTYLKRKGIWHGELFPDVAGIAHALRKDVFGLND